MLNVQKYLESNTLDDLRKNYGVVHRLCGHKVLLNYHQLEARSGCKIADECRGLILAKTNGDAILSSEPLEKSIILCFSFKRFYNHGDGSAAKIDWNSAAVQEKVDGTLIQLYFDPFKNEWHASTRNVPEANTYVNGYPWTFRDLFEETLRSYLNIPWRDLSNIFSENRTYMFELCTPWNRVVVDHQHSKIYDLGSRDIKTLEELPGYLNPPRIFSLSDINDIIEFVNSKNPLQQEGVVVVDKHFNRIKIKNLAYVTYNKLHDTLGNSNRNCLILVLEEKADDVLPVVPPVIKNNIICIQEKTRQYINKLEKKFTEGKQFAGEDDPKTFVDWASREAAKDNSIWVAPLIDMYRKKSDSVIDFLNKNKRDGEYKSTHLKTILEKIKT